MQTHATARCKRSPSSGRPIVDRLTDPNIRSTIVEVIVSTAHGELRATLVRVIEECLHEPRSRAGALARSALRNERRWQHETLRCLRRLKCGRPHGVEVTPRESSRLAAFSRYLEQESAPVVLAGLHFGNFLLDLVKLLDAAPVGTRVFAPIPARSSITLEPLAAYAGSCGKELRLLPIKHNLALALRHVAAHDVVFLLCDLGRNYGQTIRSSMFGIPVDVVAGPYAVARMLKASIVFQCAAPTRGGGEVSFDAPNDDCTVGGCPSIEALASLYVRRMERAVQTQPDFWGRWGAFPELIGS